MTEDNDKEKLSLRVRGETETRELVCPLTDEEWAAKAAKLTALDSKILESEEKKKLATKQMADTIKALRKQHRELVTEAHTRTELRKVACYWEADYGRNVRVLKRSDTGDIVDTQAMSFEDRQINL